VIGLGMMSLPLLVTLMTRLEQLIIDGALCTLSSIPRGWSDMVLFDAKLQCRLEGEQEETVARVLFDTGALSANYVSKRWFDEVKSKIDEIDIFRQKTRVRMADSVTVQDPDTAVRLTLVLTGSAGDPVYYTGKFVVLDMQHNDIIMGLPAIVGDLWHFFVTSIEHRHSTRAFGHGDYVCAYVDELIEPWAKV
jgi:hypothetical protein